MPMQENEAFEIVRRSFRNRRLPHAYVVAGAPRGAGGSFARRVCSLLLCERGPEEAPCGACGACGRVERGAHPDVVTLEPEKKSRIIPIDAMRGTFLPWAAEKSFDGGWKIGVLLFADRLKTEAANALLKTLEEPPEDTLFLLVTDRPEELLPTILSRCQRIDLSAGRIPPAEPWRTRVAEALAEHSCASQLRVMATAMRLHALFEEMKELAEDAVREDLRAAEAADPTGYSAPDKDTFEAMAKTKEKELRLSVYVALQDWYRDLLVLSSLPPGAPEPPLFFPEFRDALAERARRVPPHLALRYVDFAKEIQSHVEDRFMNDVFVLSHWLTWMR